MRRQQSRRGEGRPLTAASVAAVALLLAGPAAGFSLYHTQQGARCVGCR